MSSILFGKSDSYLNIGTDLEWRRVLRHHTTSLWVKTTCQSRCCLASLQNEGFEVFGIDINVCHNPIAAASTLLQKGPLKKTAVIPDGQEGPVPVIDSDEEDIDEAIFDAFAPASTYFTAQGAVADSGEVDGDEDEEPDDDNEDNEDECPESPLSINAPKLRSAPSVISGSEQNQLLSRKDKLANQMLARARALSTKAQHAKTASVVSYDGGDAITIAPSSLAGSHNVEDEEGEGTRRKDLGNLPCHVDVEKRYPSGGLRVRLQDCAGNMLVAVSAIPVIADDKWHHIEVTILPKGLQVPELLEGGDSGLLRRSSSFSMGDEIDPLNALLGMVDPSQDPLVVLDARERRLRSEFMAKSPAVRYSNTMVRLAIDGQEVAMKHFTRSHNHEAAAAKRRNLKRLWLEEVAALDADTRLVEELMKKRGSHGGVSATSSGPLSIPETLSGAYDATLEANRRSKELSTQHFKHRENTMERLRRNYELQKHLSKVFFLQNDFSSKGIMQKNLYPAPDLIGARNRQANASVLADQESPSSESEGDVIDTPTAELQASRPANKLSHYYCGRIADIRITDNSIGADLDQLFQKGAFSQSTLSSKSMSEKRSRRDNRQSLFALGVAAESVVMGSTGKHSTTSFIGGLLRRSALTASDRAATPHTTGLVEQLRWWATDSSEGLTVWDRGVSSTEFDGEVFLRVGGGRETKRSSFANDKPSFTSEGPSSKLTSGGLHNGLRIQPLHLHMCNCLWDVNDSPQSAMFIDSSLGYTARIPALSRRLLSCLLGCPMRLDTKLRLTEGGAPAVFEDVSLAPLTTAEVAGATHDATLSNRCTVEDDGAKIVTLTLLGKEQLKMDPLRPIEATHVPLRRKSTTTPGDMLRPGSGDGHHPDLSNGQPNLSTALIEKGFGFSIWLRTECMEPSLVLSFPFGRDPQTGPRPKPAVGEEDATSPSALLAASDLQDAHLFLNCDRHPSITFVVGDVAYVSHTNICNGAWNQLSWALDRDKIVSLRINNDLSTYEVVNLAGACLGMKRHLRMAARKKGDRVEGSVSEGPIDPSAAFGRNRHMRFAGTSAGRSRSTPAFNTITWGAEEISPLDQEEADTNTETNRSQAQGGENATTIEMLKKAVGSSIHHDRDDHELLNNFGIDTASSSEADEGQDTARSDEAKAVEGIATSRTSSGSFKFPAEHKAEGSQPHSEEEDEEPEAEMEGSPVTPTTTQATSKPVVSGRRRWPLRKNLPAGEFRGPHGDLSPNGPPILATLMSGQKRGKYELAERDRKYEKGLKKAFNINATDRHRDARTTYLNEKDKAAGHRSKSLPASRGRMLSAASEDSVSIAYLADLPPPRTRADRILRVMIGVLGEVSSAAVRASLPEVTEGGNDLASLRRQQDTLSGISVKTNAPAVGANAVFRMNEERKLLSAIGASLQRFCHTIGGSPTGALPNFTPSSPNGLFGSSARDQRFGDGSVANLSIQSAPLMWRSARHSELFSDDDPKGTPMPFPSPTLLGASGSRGKRVSAVPMAAVIVPPTAAKAHPYEVKKWVPSTQIVSIDSTDSEADEPKHVAPEVAETVVELTVEPPEQRRSLPESAPIDQPISPQSSAFTFTSSGGIRKKNIPKIQSPRSEHWTAADRQSPSHDQRYGPSLTTDSFVASHPATELMTSNMVRAGSLGITPSFGPQGGYQPSQPISLAKRAQLMHVNHALQTCSEALVFAADAEVPASAPVGGAGPNDVVTIGGRYCGGVRDLSITFGNTVEFYFPLSEGRGRDVTSRPAVSLKPLQSHLDTLLCSKGVQSTGDSERRPDLLTGLLKPLTLAPLASATTVDWATAIVNNPKAAEAVKGAGELTCGSMAHSCTTGTVTMLKQAPPHPPQEHHRSYLQLDLANDSYLSSLLLLSRLKVEPTGRVCLWEKAQLPSGYCVVSPYVAIRLGPVILPANSMHLNIVGYTVDPEEDDEEPNEGSTLVPAAAAQDSDEPNSDEETSQSMGDSSNPATSPAVSKEALSAVMGVDLGQSIALDEAQPEENASMSASLGEGSALATYARRKRERADRERRKLERKAERNREETVAAAAAAATQTARMVALSSQIQNSSIPKGLRRAAASAEFDGSIVVRGFLRLAADGSQNYYGHAITLNGVFVLDIDREVIRVVIRDGLHNIVRNRPTSHSSSHSGAGNPQDSSSALNSSRSIGGVRRRTSEHSESPSIAHSQSFRSLATATTDAHVAANPLPGEHDAPVPGLSNAPYQLVPKEQVLIVYSCSALTFEDHKWHYVELTIKPARRSIVPTAIAPQPVKACGSSSVGLVIDHVSVPLTPIAVDYKGYRALVRRQQQAAAKTTTANAMPVEPELGRKGRRGPSRVGFSSNSVGATSGGNESPNDGAVSKRSSLNVFSAPQTAVDASFSLSRKTSAASISGVSASQSEASKGSSSLRVAMLMYAGPRSTLSSVRSGHVKCKHLEVKWRELVEYVPPMVGETVLFSGLFSHELYIGGCGWNGGARDLEVLVDGNRRVWPLDDGAGGKFTQFPLAYDPSLANHVKALPKPFRKPEAEAGVVAVPPAAPSAGPLGAGSVLSSSSHQQQVKHADPTTIIASASPLVLDSVTAGYTAAAIQWKTSPLPMQALSFDGRHSVASAVNFAQVFQAADFRCFSIVFWVKQGMAGQRAMAVRAPKRKGAKGTEHLRLGASDDGHTRRGCLLSVHDVVFPSLEASLGVYAHTALDMFSSPKKREASPYTTLFVLLDSSERGLVLETNVDIYDGSWHKIEWRVNDAERNDTVVLINDRSAAVTVVAAEGPRDFQGKSPCLTVGARNDGDGGIREHFKGEIKNLAVRVGSQRRKRDLVHSDFERRGSHSRDSAFADTYAHMTPVLEWTMSEGRGGLLYDTLKNVVGVVLRPSWGVTSFPPQVPRLSGDSTLKFASISDLSRAFFRRGVRIDVTIKTGNSGIGSVFAIQSPSRRMVGGLVLNTHGGSAGTLLTPHEELLNFKLATDGSCASLPSIRSAKSVTSDGQLRSPRHGQDGEARHSKVGASVDVLEDDPQGGVGMLDAEMLEARSVNRGSTSVNSEGHDSLHEAGTHSFVIQHITRRYMYRSQESVINRYQSRRKFEDSSQGSNSPRESFDRTGSGQPSPLIDARSDSPLEAPKARKSWQAKEGPAANRKKMVLALPNTRLSNFTGPQLVALSDDDYIDSDEDVDSGSSHPSLSSGGQVRSEAELRRRATEMSTAAAMSWHLRTVGYAKGLPPQRVLEDHPEVIEGALDEAEGDDDDHYGGSIHRSRRNLRQVSRRDMLGQVETVVEELQFQFHCDELNDENWHQIQISLPMNPYDTEIYVDEIRMPLLVVTAKVVAIVPDGFSRVMKESRKAQQPPSPAELQFGWESLVVGRTARAKSFKGDIKNISIASFDDASFLYVPLANSVEMSSTMPREVATSNIEWELTVSPPSCLSFSDQEHVVLPALGSFRYDCFQIEALLSTVTSTRSCFLEYGAYDSGFASIRFNEDATGEHRPYHVHILVADQAGRELRADFKCDPMSPNTFLFDSKWHKLRIIINSSRENDILVFIDDIPLDVRYGNCGSPCEFAYADEGGTIGAQVVDLKPLLPFCGKLQQFIVSDPRTDEIHATYEMNAGYGSVLQDGSGKRNHAVIHNVQWKTKMNPEKSTLIAASGRTDALIDGEVTVLSTPQLQARRRAKQALQQKSLPIFDAKLTKAPTPVLGVSRRPSSPLFSLKPPPEATDLMISAYRGGAGDRTSSVTRIKEVAQNLPRKGIILTASRWCNSTLNTFHRSVVTGDTIMPYWPHEEGGWESGAPGPQWITIDLGQPCTIFSIAFELPRSFSTTYQLYFARINLNESYSANRLAMVASSAVPAMTLVEEFNFTASTPRSAVTSFALPYFNIRWIRLRCTEPAATSQVTIASTAAARQLRERQIKQLHVTLRSLKIIGMSNAFVAPKRETVLTVLKRKSVQSQRSRNQSTFSFSHSEFSANRSQTRSDSIPFGITKDSAYAAALAELEFTEREQEEARVEAEIYARLNPPQPLAPIDSRASSASVIKRATTTTQQRLEADSRPRQGSLPEMGNTVPFDLIATGGYGQSRNFTAGASSSANTPRTLGNSLSVGTRNSVAQNVPTASEERYEPVLLQLRAPYLAWRSNTTPLLPNLYSTPQTKTGPRASLGSPRKAETPPPVLLRPGELPATRQPKPLAPLPTMAPRPSQIQYPRAMLGFTSTPLPPVGQKDEGGVTTDGVLISKPAFERFVTTTNEAEQKKVTLNALFSNTVDTVDGRATRVSQRPLEDPVARARDDREKELKLLFYRFDVSRAGAINLPTFWDLYEAAGGNVLLTGDDDEGMMAQLEDEDTDEEVATPSSPSLTAAKRGSNTPTASSLTPSPTSPVLRLLARERERRTVQTKAPPANWHGSNASKRSPRKQKKKSGETRSRERVLRALYEVGVPIPYRMFHSNIDEEEELKRKQYLQEIRQGQLGLSAGSAALEEVLPVTKIMVSFDQFSRVVARLQRF